MKPKTPKLSCVISLINESIQVKRKNFNFQHQFFHCLLFLNHNICLMLKTLSVFFNEQKLIYTMLSTEFESNKVNFSLYLFTKVKMNIFKYLLQNPNLFTNIQEHSIFHSFKNFYQRNYFKF